MVWMGVVGGLVSSVVVAGAAGKAGGLERMSRGGGGFGSIGGG